MIAYASRHLNPAEKNYSTTEKECLAILWGIRKMRQYLEGYKFTVITDHLSLKWLQSINNPTGRLARWALELQQYDFTIQYRRGNENVVADALSRQPVETCQLAATTEQNTEYQTQCQWIKKKRAEIQTNPVKYPDYAWVNNQLYRHFPAIEPDDVEWKLCVPQNLRKQVLQENHNQPAAGHLGVRKTVARVCRNYYWPGMYRDIKKYVLSCESCQKYKASQLSPAGEMLTRIPDEPWSILCTDFVGPLPRSKHGNTMLLVFVDKFSKWVELTIPCARLPQMVS